MKVMIRILLAGTLALVLAACSSSNDGKINDLEGQVTDLEGQITAATAALTAAGAEGADLAALVADLVDKVSQGTMDLGTANTAITTAMTALTAAGAEGADLAALVASAAAKIAELTPPPDSRPGLGADEMALAMEIGTQALPMDTAPTVTTAGKPMDTKLVASDMAIADTGWMGAAYTKANTDPESTDLVVLYNNKEDPKATTFSMGVYTLNRDKGDTDNDPNTNEALTLITDHLAEIGGVADFPSAALQQNVPFDEDSEYEGTLQGAKGTFTCGDASCTLSTDEDGKLSALAADMWYFTPDKGAKRQVPDTDYIHFGFWKNTSMNDKDEPVFMVRGISGGTMESVANVIGALEGEANYVGPATGKYVRKEFDANGNPAHLWGGQFTASADLNVYFGGPDVAANKHDTITGMIDGFTDDGGEDIGDGTWIVTLKANFDPYTQDGISGTTEGDTDMMGNWTGRFFGEVVADGAQSTLPSSIVGEFNGHFVNGHVLGAFGAEEQ
jgi:hypothetical protein